jgi:flagellar basal-body rod modification protein FlgD
MSLVSSVETSTSSTVNSSSTDRTQTLGKDEFLQLLITKLQNQDPLQPMNDEDFIAQLAQFSTLEQMNNIADGITQANQWDYLQMQSLNNAMAAGLIGKDIQAKYDTLYIDDKNTPEIGFSVSSYAATVEFTIKDADGNVVATLVDEDVNPGAHTISWDGKDELGQRVPTGRYTIEAVAHDANGDTFTPDLILVGTVEAITYRDGSAYLQVNGVEIPLGYITAIGEPGAFDND